MILKYAFLHIARLLFNLEYRLVLITGPFLVLRTMASVQGVVLLV
jgi:hypothetical protein